MFVCLLMLDLLQEFWVGNEELVNLYEKRLGDAGYVNFKLGRTNNRGDGKHFTLSFVTVSVFFGIFCLRDFIHSTKYKQV